MIKMLGAAGLCFSLMILVAGAQSPPPVVSIITAADQPVYDEQSYVGRIQAPNVVRLQARVEGYLEQQAFADGQTVKKGQLLYVIEQPPYEALVDQAAATVAQAEAQTHNAELTLARAQALLHTAAGQQSVLDLAQAAALSDQAAVLSAEAQLKTAQINLGYTEIRSPMDGVIGATTVNVGNVVGPQSGTLATIVSEDPMYVGFSLPMADVIRDRRRAGLLELKLVLPDGSTYGPSGAIDFVSNQVTSSTDTLAWRATIANPKHDLSDGEYVTVLLRARQAKMQIVIPLAAMIADQLGDYVLEVGPENKVIRRDVALGTQSNTSVPVLSGIAPGDRIITEGIQSVHPGMVVNPQPAQGG